MSPTPDPRTDAELLREARREPATAASRAAASELFGRYRTKAYLWCHRVVRDHDLALDLAQDALLSAWRGLAGFDERAQFSSWLFAIVRNRCLTAVRPRANVRDESVDPDDLFAGGRDPLDVLASAQEEQRVLDAIREDLEPVEQEALWLRAVERMPVDEITRVLELKSASGARGVLQSARRKLKARFGGSGEDA
ncbi:MAG: sigma-70 family RNA polymerase sigma factor [Candidatus Eisenbacteria bacterium]